MGNAIYFGDCVTAAVVVASVHYRLFSVLLECSIAKFIVVNNKQVNTPRGEKISSIFSLKSTFCHET